tara:strand:+ start:157 stop:1626 length:1470 start_codon:yes stop_codon:yes gene_type:complete
MVYYVGQDLEDYEAGNFFLPRNQYTLNRFNNTVAPVPPEIIPEAPQSFGITNTNAFTGGDGVGGGLNDYGLDMSNTKMFDKNVYSRDMVSGPQEAIASGKTTPTFSWQNKQVQGFYDPKTGQYKTAKGKNIEHGGINFQPMLASLFGLTKEGPQIGDIEGTFTHGWKSGKKKIKEAWEEEKDKWAGITGIKKYKAFKKAKKEQKLKDEILADNFKAAMDAQQAHATSDEDLKNIQQIQQHTGQGLSDYRMSRPESERQFTGGAPKGTTTFDTKSGMGRRDYNTGGRIGFKDGAQFEAANQGMDISPGTTAKGEFRDTPPETNWITKNKPDISTIINVEEDKASKILGEKNKRHVPVDIGLAANTKRARLLANLNLRDLNNAMYEKRNSLSDIKDLLDPSLNLSANVNNLNLGYRTNFDDQNTADISYAPNDKFTVGATTDFNNINLGATYQPNDWFTLGGNIDDQGKKYIGGKLSWKWGGQDGGLVSIL